MAIIDIAVSVDNCLRIADGTSLVGIEKALLTISPQHIPKFKTWTMRLLCWHLKDVSVMRSIGTQLVTRELTNLSAT